MRLHNLKPAAGARHNKKTVGRGGAHGRSATRGTKGQRARSGGAKPMWFEGGQTPLIRRIPKRGFSNKSFATVYNIVNLSTLNTRFDDDTEITPQLLFEKNIIKRKGLPIKILNGDLEKKFRIHAHKVSKSAAEKIKTLGGEVIKP